MTEEAAAIDPSRNSNVYIPTTIHRTVMYSNLYINFLDRLRSQITPVQKRPRSAPRPHNWQCC